MKKNQKLQLLNTATRNPKFRARFLADPAAASEGLGIQLTPDQVDAINAVVGVIREKGRFVPCNIRIQDIFVQNRAGDAPPVKKKKKKGGKKGKKGNK